VIALSPPLQRVARCLSVSVFTTLVSLTTLAILTSAFGVTPWRANVVATAVGTVPSYQLNRRWVWRLRGASDMRREVAPFWALSLTGLLVSTLAVDRADRLASTLGITGVVRTGSLLAANVTAFALLWVGQFLLLDRVLFRHRPPVAPEPRI
jgi:putative flippase GtrA